MKEMVYGFTPSVLDGTELKFSVSKNLPTPEAYTYVSYMSPILDQGIESICVPCSISAHLNWNKNMDTGTTGKDHKVNLYEIYDVRKNKGQEGMSFKEALNFLKTKGVSSASGKMKIRNYCLIGSELALKQAILMNGPCLGAFMVWNNDREFWNKRFGDSMLGGHAISIVGWNKQGFIIRNSWGTHWGNMGYTTLKYSDFNKLIEIWSIID